MKRLLTTIIVTGLLSGCTFNDPKGPIFEKYGLKTNDKALVYVYRPLGESFGYDRTYYLFDGEKKIANLKHGGYIPFEFNPGKVSLLSDVNDSARIFFSGGPLLYSIEKSQSKNAYLEFVAEKGNTYFVRFKPITHATYFEPTLALVQEDEGMKEIRECKLIIERIEE